MPVLRLLEGNAPHQQYSIESDRVVLGRDSHHEIWLDHRKVSRVHAEVVRIGNDYYLVDCNSRNGTRLNGKPVKPGVRYPLRYGDVIQVSEYRFDYVDTSASDASLTVCPGVVVVEDGEKIHSTAAFSSKIPLSSQGDLDSFHIANAEAKLAALMRFTRKLQQVLSLEKVLEEVLDCLLVTFPEAERGIVVLRDSSGNVVPSAVRSRVPLDGAAPISRTVVAHVLNGPEAVVTNDAAHDPRFDKSASLHESAVRSLMCAPLIDREGRAFGAVHLDTTTDEFDHGDLDLLTTITVQVSLAVENTRLHEQTARQEAMRRDVSLAREVQLDLLPGKPPAIEGFRFFDFYAPARDVGGDYFDYVVLPDGRLGIVVADVSGKGVAAAMVSTILCSEIRAYLGLGIDPCETVTRINGNFNDRTSERCFVTMVLLVVDPSDGRVTLVNAGHWCPLHRGRDGGLREAGRKEVGFPVGAVPGVEYEQAEMVLEPGESLVLFSDGIVEAMNLKQDIYGAERIRALVAAHDGTANELGEALVDDVTEFVGPARQTDDICVICISRDRA